MVNEGPSSFFKASKGLRQGNPLSPPLFIVVMEVLNTNAVKSQKLELFKCLKLGEGEHMKEVIHIFFVDNILVPCEPDERVILNLICILLSFQAVSELNIKLAKPKLVRLGDGRMLLIWREL